MYVPEQKASPNVVLTRMRAGLFVALVMGLSLSVLDAGPAHACSCMSLPLQDSVDSSDAVFSGEVQSIDEDAASPGGGMMAPGRITFAVQDSWKGVAAESVSVYGQGDGANCYNRFEQGEAYLVYASHAKKADDALKNNACGETKPLVTAEADLRLLGPPASELPETGGPSPNVIFGVSIVVAGLLMSGMIFARQYTRDQQP